MRYRLCDDEEDVTGISVELAIQDYQDVWIDDTAPATRKQ